MLKRLFPPPLFFNCLLLLLSRTRRGDPKPFSSADLYTATVLAPAAAACLACTASPFVDATRTLSEVPQCATNFLYLSLMRDPYLTMGKRRRRLKCASFQKLRPRSFPNWRTIDHITEQLARREEKCSSSSFSTTVDDNGSGKMPAKKG